LVWRIPWTCSPDMGKEFDYLVYGELIEEND